MMVRIFLILACLLQAPLADAQGLFGNNKKDDSFAVKAIDGRSATVEGASKDLKAGDTLYYNRSPFHFIISEVKGQQITIELPEKHELAVGRALLRFPTDAIKKSIETEARLKRVFEE